MAQPLDLTGTPGGIRTPDLRIRSPLLYPAELLVHGSVFILQIVAQLKPVFFQAPLFQP